MSRRKIGVFTSSRGDLGSLWAVMKAMNADRRIEQLVLAGGVHATPGGFVGAEFPVEAESIVVLPGNDGGGDGPTHLLASSHREAEAVANVLLRWQPDMLLLLGDRYELLGVMTAATLCRVPVAHLHGGEITVGVIDDSIRHAVTKLAHLHLCAAEPYAARVRSMGEESWRVHVVGDPAIDRLLGLRDSVGPEGLKATLGANLQGLTGLVTYHPPTLTPELAVVELEAIIAATSPLQTVVATYPGRDPGADAIIERLQRWAREDARVILVPALGSRYPAVLARADVVIGNSSSGIVEAPTFRVPSVDVGRRQEGRVRASSVLHSQSTAAAVAEAVRTALDVDFRASLDGQINPYGDGKSAARVVEVLATQMLDGILVKRFVDPPH